MDSRESAFVLGQRYNLATLALVVALLSFLNLAGLEKAILAIVIGFQALKPAPAPALEQRRLQFGVIGQGNEFVQGGGKKLGHRIAVPVSGTLMCLKQNAILHRQAHSAKAGNRFPWRVHGGFAKPGFIAVARRCRNALA